MLLHDVKLNFSDAADTLLLSLSSKETLNFVIPLTLAASSANQNVATITTKLNIDENLKE